MCVASIANVLPASAIDEVSPVDRMPPRQMYRADGSHDSW
jgi:hypothetical protein